MIFSSIFSAFMQLVFKPQILIPMIVLVLASAAVVEVSGTILERPLNDFTLNAVAPTTDNILGMFLFNYPLEILGMVVIGSIMLGVGIIAWMSTTRMAKGEGLAKAVNTSVLEGGKTIGLVILFWAIFIIAGTALLLATGLSMIESTVGMIATIIVLIILFVVFVKLSFVFPALINKELKKALQESWKFTNKKFWGTVALIIIAGIIALVLGVVLSQIGILIGGFADPILSALGDAVGGTYFVAAVTNYFYSK